MAMQVDEVVPGEFDVEVDGIRTRVLIPAGVGLPGVDDADLAAGVVVELRGGPRPLPSVIDVSQALGSYPGLLAALAARFDDDDHGDHNPDRPTTDHGAEG